VRETLDFKVYNLSALTYGTPLGVGRPDAFNSMHLDVHFLPWPQLRKHDVGVRRIRALVAEYGGLFALWLPLKVRREN
jgi:hypothetical protein